LLLEGGIDVTVKYGPKSATGFALWQGEREIAHMIANHIAGGDLLSFGVDLDETDVAGPNGAAGGNSADLLGGGVLIPSGRIVPGGASFFGNFDGGFPFRGEFHNILGRGYSQLDGYGFINAEAAVKAVQKKHK